MEITQKVLMNAVNEYVMKRHGAYTFYQKQNCQFGQDPDRVLSDVARQLNKAGIYKFALIDSGENSQYLFVTLQF